MKQKIKKIIFPTYNKFKKLKNSIGLSKNDNSVFERIFRNKDWGRCESVSGFGSTLNATTNIRRELPIFFKNNKIQTLIDVPCGDMFWAQHILKHLKGYIGIDVVQEIIDTNLKLYSGKNVKFFVGDITNCKLPKADAIIVRDLFIHFPENKIKATIKNLLNSEIRFLIFSNYPEIEYYKEIDLGDCRSVNLLRHPFNLPDPEYIIDEDWEGKNLSIWELKTIKKCIDSTGIWK